MSTLIDLPLDNDYEPKWSLKQNNTSSGVREPATGVTHTAYFSLTKGGSAITGLTFAAIERVGKPGSYFVIFPGPALRTALAALIGKIIYLMVGNGTMIFFDVPHKVKAFRDL